MDDYPYKECPTEREHQIIKAKNLSIYMILEELVCHFHVCDDIDDAKGPYIWHKKWADYFLLI